MTIQEYRDNPVILSFGTAAGPEVQDVKEVKIPVEGAEILALVYIPPGAPAGPLPCYINYHGGGVSAETSVLDP